MTLVYNHHVGAAVEVGKRICDATDFFPQAIMQRKQMMDLRVERRLCGVVVLTPCRWERRRRESEVWRRSLRIVWIQRVGDGKTRVVSIGGIKIVGNICKTVFEDPDFARQGF